eukprot:TRINITY_DN8216_c0_g1_i1.p1 TRINITY_DN8216_c0_g1~~TRINITY_DN8216_c0_g1_i1.p1  ORF type:complete len:887 (-),score=168.12 TRINITY_DN8216_c0_g1_i1:38-2698(-)
MSIRVDGRKRKSRRSSFFHKTSSGKSSYSSESATVSSSGKEQSRSHSRSSRDYSPRDSTTRDRSYSISSVSMSDTLTEDSLFASDGGVHMMFSGIHETEVMFVTAGARSLITSGSLENVIEHYTKEPTDADWKRFLIFAHTHFVSSEYFIGEIISSFKNITPTDDMQHEIVALRHINIIKTWIDISYSTFDENVRQIIMDFIEETDADREIKIGPHITEAIDRVNEHISEEEEDPPLPVELMFTLGDELSLLSVNIVELARQVTLIDHNLISKIEIEELQYPHWTEEDGNMNRKHSPNVVKYRKWCDKFAYWLVMQVVKEHQLLTRIAKLEALLSLGNELLNCNNYNLVIFLALNQSPLTRLKKTWMNISKKAFKDWKRIKNTFDMSNNWSEYRTSYKNSPEPKILALEIILKEIFNICVDPTSDDFLDEGRTIINMMKLNNLGEMIDYIVTCKNQSFSYVPFGGLQKILTSLPYYTLTDVDQESKKCIPSEKELKFTFHNWGHSDDDRKLKKGFSGKKLRRTTSPNSNGRRYKAGRYDHLIMEEIVNDSRNSMFLREVSRIQEEIERRIREVEDNLESGQMNNTWKNVQIFDSDGIKLASQIKKKNKKQISQVRIEAPGILQLDKNAPKILIHSPRASEYLSRNDSLVSLINSMQVDEDSKLDNISIDLSDSMESIALLKLYDFKAESCIESMNYLHKEILNSEESDNILIMKLLVTETKYAINALMDLHSRHRLKSKLQRVVKNGKSYVVTKDEESKELFSKELKRLITLIGRYHEVSTQEECTKDKKFMYIRVIMLSLSELRKLLTENELKEQEYIRFIKLLARGWKQLTFAYPEFEQHYSLFKTYLMESKMMIQDPNEQNKEALLELIKQLSIVMYNIDNPQ